MNSLNKVTLLLGDCRLKLQDLPDNSVDSVVTDPPYGLSFMGKKWDYDVPSVEIWREVLRVLKPGGHLLSFGGTRTYHRMVVNIEDAGFEIRDCIQWLYGSGFPKSHNIKEGEFKGYGTALKPANEPIVVARKPLEAKLTIAQNVAKYGCGAINIDGSRIGTEVRENAPASSLGNSKTMDGGAANPNQQSKTVIGRWPANIILDEAAAHALDFQTDDTVSRFFYVAKTSKSERNAGLEGMPQKNSPKFDGGEFQSASTSAKERHNENFHPTVKPVKLMQYLINLVTPPNGTVLDPFMGSGTTGVAAVNLQRPFIGCEMSEEYLIIAKARIDNASKTDESQVSETNNIVEDLESVV